MYAAALLCPAASKPKHAVCHLLTTIVRKRGGLLPSALSDFGIQTWILDVHQEAGSMHFN